MRRKNNTNINNVNLLSLVDLLSGALGAIILLFLLVPKGTRINTEAPLPTWIDPRNGSVWSEIPDSLRLKLKIKTGDTLQMVIIGYKSLPKDSVMGRNLPALDNYRPSWQEPTSPTPVNTLPTVTSPTQSSTPPGFTGCKISVYTDAFQCLDNDTKNNPYDDRFTFQLTVSTVNGGSKGWKGSIDNTEIKGNYGENITLGPFNLNTKTYSLNITDIEKEDCVFRTEIASTAPCSDPMDGREPGAPLLGSLVFEVRWDNLDKDLDLVVKRNNVMCWVGNKRTAFGNYFKEKGKKMQEAIRSYKDVKPGKYEIFVWNHIKKQGPTNAIVSATLGDKNNKIQFYREFKKEVSYAKFPGVKLGDLEISAGGQAVFTPIN